MWGPSVIPGRLISDRARRGTNVQARLRRNAGSYPVSLCGEQDRMGTVGHTELAVKVVYVAAHGALGQSEVDGDLLVPLALGQSAQSLLLHLRKGRRLLRHGRRPAT